MLQEKVLLTTQKRIMDDSELYWRVYLVKLKETVTVLYLGYVMLRR